MLFLGVSTWCDTYCICSSDKTRTALSQNCQVRCVVVGFVTLCKALFSSILTFHTTHAIFCFVFVFAFVLNFEFWIVVFFLNISFAFFHRWYTIKSPFGFYEYSLCMQTSIVSVETDNKTVCEKQTEGCSARYCCCMNVVVVARTARSGTTLFCVREFLPIPYSTINRALQQCINTVLPCRALLYVIILALSYTVVDLRALL